MDVFQVVKALRIQKPGSVLTVVSCACCRTVIHQYVHARNIQLEFTRQSSAVLLVLSWLVNAFQHSSIHT